MNNRQNMRQINNRQILDLWIDGNSTAFLELVTRAKYFGIRPQLRRAAEALLTVLLFKLEAFTYIQEILTTSVTSENLTPLFLALDDSLSSIRVATWDFFLCDADIPNEAQETAFLATELSQPWPYSNIRLGAFMDSMMLQVIFVNFKDIYPNVIQMYMDSQNVIHYNPIIHNEEFRASYSSVTYNVFLGFVVAGFFAMNNPYIFDLLNLATEGELIPIA